MRVWGLAKRPRQQEGEKKRTGNRVQKENASATKIENGRKKAYNREVE